MTQPRQSFITTPEADIFLGRKFGYQYVFPVWYFTGYIVSWMSGPGGRKTEPGGISYIYIYKMPGKILGEKKAFL